MQQTVRIMVHPTSQSIGMASGRHDIIVYSHDMQPALIVEVSSAKENSPERAAEFRQGLLERDPLLDKSFLLLAYNGTVFLWEKGAALDAKPEVASVADVLKTYAGPYLEGQRWL